MIRVWSNGPLLLAVAMACWSGSVIVGRAAADLIPPVLFTTLRWSLALAIAVPIAWPHLRRQWPLLWTRKWLVALFALLGVVVYNILMYRGLHATTALNALLLQSATPLLVLIANAALFRERPTGIQATAIAVSVVGVLVITAAGSLTALRSLAFNPGDALVIAAVAAYAVYSSALRRRPAVHPFAFLAATIGLGVGALVPMAVAEAAAGARMHGTAGAWLAVAYAGVFASFTATLCFNRGVELVGAARAGQYLHLIPVFGTLLAVFFLGEHLRPFHAVGIALIATGLLLASGASASQVWRPNFGPRTPKQANEQTKLTAAALDRISGVMFAGAVLAPLVQATDVLVPSAIAWILASGALHLVARLTLRLLREEG